LSLERDDIDAAVAAGVIPQAQADALNAFAAERRRARFGQSGQEDESFRFMTGFNDFFSPSAFCCSAAGSHSSPLEVRKHGPRRRCRAHVGSVRIAGAAHAARVARHSAVGVPYFLRLSGRAGGSGGIVGAALSARQPARHTLFGITGAPLVTAPRR